MAKLTPRMVVALRALEKLTDATPQSSEKTGWRSPARQSYAFLVADAIEAAGLNPNNRRAANTRPATGAANTLVALRRRGLVGGGFGMAFDSTTWWITPEGVKALEEVS